MLIRTTRKTETEDDDGSLPIPTQLVSNGEFCPPPQTAKQKKIEALIREMADERARKLGLSRRSFLRTAAGSATALAALNIASGCNDGDSGGFQVQDCDTRDPAAARETFAKEFFIVDVQTHHVDLSDDRTLDPALESFFAGFRICNQDQVTQGKCTRGAIEELSRANYLKEMLLDSETAVAMMSGLPAPSRPLQAISNEGMAATKDLGNQLGASQRMLTQGMVMPNYPSGHESGLAISDMEHMVKDLGARAFKTYTGAGGGVFGDYLPWWLDDEQVAYPMIEEALRLGIDIINTHKGLRLGIFDAEHIKVRDVPKVVRDWPQMNFVIYHSGFEYVDELARIKREELASHSNLNAELGAIFASRVTSDDPVAAIGHLLGTLLNSFGPDHIIWGTDSIWYGSPQWQINAMKTFKMPQAMMDEFGYPEVTDEIKAKIFGLNASRLYKLDPDELRCTLPQDGIAQAKAAYQEIADPSLRTYGPKTRREFFAHWMKLKENPFA